MKEIKIFFEKNSINIISIFLATLFIYIISYLTISVIFFINNSINNDNNLIYKITFYIHKYPFIAITPLIIAILLRIHLLVKSQLNIKKLKKTIHTLLIISLFIIILFEGEDLPYAGINNYMRDFFYFFIKRDIIQVIHINKTFLSMTLILLMILKIKNKYMMVIFIFYFKIIIIYLNQDIFLNNHYPENDTHRYFTKLALTTSLIIPTQVLEFKIGNKKTSTI